MTSRLIRASQAQYGLIIILQAMGKKNKEGKKLVQPKKKGGCIKMLFLMTLLLVIAYIGIHLFFLWQPAGKPAKFNQQIIDLNVAGQKIFPVVLAFDSDKISGRSEIIAGNTTKDPLIKARLKTALDNKYPVTFREDEINIWLSKRIQLKQAGLLAPLAKARYVWVDFKEDEIEVIIERELSGEQIHMTSLFMKFERAKNGYSISRHSSQIGQVRAPGGFARLIMPAFNNLAAELSDEMKLYKNEEGQLLIHDVKVEDGKITFDPRPSVRNE